MNSSTGPTVTQALTTLDTSPVSNNLEFTENFNVTLNNVNVTDSWKSVEELKLANQCVLGISVALRMIALGSFIQPDELKKALHELRLRISAIFALICQVLLMPLIGFILALSLQLEPSHALGALITASCPFSWTSVAINYWKNKGIYTSAEMMFFSTVVTLDAMPLNLFMYGRRWTERGAVIPYKDITIVLVILICLMVLGMLLRWRMSWLASLISKYYASISSLGILVSVILTIFINPTFWSSTWKFYVATLAHVWGDWALGYSIARILDQPLWWSRTVGFWGAFRQVGIALTFVSFSYEDIELFLGAVVYPMFFGPLSFLSQIARNVGYRIYKRCETDSNLAGNERGENDSGRAKEKDDGTKNYIPKSRDGDGKGVFISGLPKTRDGRLQKPRETDQDLTLYTWHDIDTTVGRRDNCGSGGGGTDDKTHYTSPSCSGYSGYSGHSGHSGSGGRTHHHHHDHSSHDYHDHSSHGHHHHDHSSHDHHHHDHSSHCDD